MIGCREESELYCSFSNFECFKGMSIAGLNSDEYLMLRILRTMVNNRLIKEFGKLEAKKNKQIYVRMNRIVDYHVPWRQKPTIIS